jgi:hypothetical protein
MSQWMFVIGGCRFLMHASVYLWHLQLDYLPKLLVFDLHLDEL